MEWFIFEKAVLIFQKKLNKKEDYKSSFLFTSNYLFKTCFVSFWNSFASQYSKTNAFHAASSLKTQWEIFSGISQELLASTARNQAGLS